MEDAIIADVSEQNGNVMLEPGIAASFRDKDRVIVIQDEESERGFLFDISPARHLVYRRGLAGDVGFRDRLRRALLFSLAPAPYVPREMPSVDPPLRLQLTRPDDSERLLGPSNSHKRLLTDGLEFGSYYVFRYSWVTLGSKSFRNIRVKADMRFTQLKPDVDVGQGWIGIMLRSQHFFANWGHLIYVVSDGTVRRTQPIDEFNKEDEDPVMGQIQSFDLNAWVQFDIRFDEHQLAGSVAGVSFNIAVSDMPYIYNAGLLRFQTHMSRACIRTLAVEIPS